MSSSNSTILPRKNRVERRDRSFLQTLSPVVESALALRWSIKWANGIGYRPEKRPSRIGEDRPFRSVGTNRYSRSTEKPLFASLLKGQSMSTITLEEALKLFDLPRTLGDFEGKTVVVGIAVSVRIFVTTANMYRCPKSSPHRCFVRGCDNIDSAKA